jgi:hypothetical protein
VSEFHAEQREHDKSQTLIYDHLLLLTQCNSDSTALSGAPPFLPRLLKRLRKKKQSYEPISLPYDGVPYEIHNENTSSAPQTKEKQNQRKTKK